MFVWRLGDGKDTFVDFTAGAGVGDVLDLTGEFLTFADALAAS